MWGCHLIRNLTFELFMYLEYVSGSQRLVHSFSLLDFYVIFNLEMYIIKVNRKILYVQMRVPSVMLSCFLSTGHIEELPLEGKEKPNPISFLFFYPQWAFASNKWSSLNLFRSLPFFSSFFYFFFNPSFVIPSFLLLFGMRLYMGNSGL